MKKYLLLLIAIISCVASAHAQSSLVATLSHEGALTHYYGTEALFTAYLASAPGDTITLSSGIFSKTSSSCTFNKTITIRGAGITNPNGPTIIRDTRLYLKASEGAIITLEGITQDYQNYYYDLTKIENVGDNQGTIKFVKCDFSYIELSDGENPTSAPSVRIYDSIIRSLSIKEQSNPDLKAYNSLIYDPRSYLASETSSSFINCIIQYASSNYDSRNAHYLNFYNCIFNWTTGQSGTSSSYRMSPTATCENCLSINKTYLFYDLLTSINNKTVGSVKDVFKTYADGYDTESEFELTEAAKAEYIGSDGTEIGMRGGMYPFTTELSYPIVSTFNVEPKTTKEGILTVEVAVDGK